MLPPYPSILTLYQSPHTPDCTVIAQMMHELTVPGATYEIAHRRLGLLPQDLLGIYHIYTGMPPETWAIRFRLIKALMLLVQAKRAAPFPSVFYDDSDTHCRHRSLNRLATYCGWTALSTMGYAFRAVLHLTVFAAFAMSADELYKTAVHADTLWQNEALAQAEIREVSHG